MDSRTTAGGPRIRIGMVGGGPGADIGATHRFAQRLDDRYELVAGVFGQDPEASKTFGAGLHVDPSRIYPDAETMADAEAEREDGIEVVTIATPNSSHLPLARIFLERGFSVVCEKPLTTSVADALELHRLATSAGVVFAVPHAYSAYAMVREAARLVRDGALGKLTLVQVEHASGWASEALERTGHKQALWRTTPEIAGFPSVVGDLGTHAFHLTRYITGLELEEVSADLSTVVPERGVIDNAFVHLHLTGGVRGALWASMVATGQEHGLRIRVFGEKGSLEWRHEDPQHLVVRSADATSTTLAQGQARLSEDAARLTRVGLGHSEGFLEAFTDFYSDVADALLARRDGAPFTPRELSFPTIDDGVLGVAFVDAAARSSSASGAWTKPSVSLADLHSREEARA
ncbi:Gfo/Idh/MocA family protein [Frondihabitans cladoniiphilus]|uniref:Gfo/Idh/MocA family oxidoreductase n=1 Tax=Frondihabitans cladoniiphilus TaxID=715785 RepID=A0ABP8VRS8_9MICO